MDFEGHLQYRFTLDIIHQRQILRHTVMSVIAYDPYLDEASKARVRSLPILKGVRDDFATQLGVFIVQQLLRIRRHMDENETRDVVRSLTIFPLTMDEFFSYFNFYVYKGCECGGWFKARESMRYLHFLITICEFCCKVAEMDELERSFSMVFEWAEFYMDLFRETFPGDEELTNNSEEDLTIFKILGDADQHVSAVGSKIR